VTAEQRACPSCGTAFTWTPAAPRQRFCSTRCKHRWHTDAPAAGVATTTPVAPPPGPAGLTAAPACPHCRQPVALVAWLVPPAASVTTPPRHADTIRDST
jgi:endogenous inhibitor of DNA gyrase (YacG/DUF329 family)